MRQEPQRHRCGTPVLQALAPGEHHLRSIGTDGYGFTVDVSYRFVVTPPTQPW